MRWVLHGRAYGGDGGDRCRVTQLGRPNVPVRFTTCGWEAYLSASAQRDTYGVKFYGGELGADGVLLVDYAVCACSHCQRRCRCTPERRDLRWLLPHCEQGLPQPEPVEEPEEVLEDGSARYN